MLRGFWAGLANAGMAFAIVTTGMIALVLEPGAGGVGFDRDDFWFSLYFAAVLLPAYLPTVLLHLFAVPVLARRLPPRVAALITAPIAPGLLWGFVAISSQEVLAIAVVGTVAYGLLARVTSENPVGAVFVSLGLVVPELLALAFESYVLLVGLLLALAFLGFAVWGFHHRRRPALP